MIIHRMKASFGCLENAQLELHEGLNVLQAANESGKSTWCAFLRCMLYGVDSSRRSKGGVRADKLRYVPWSGAPMEGELELSFRGEELTLRRGTDDTALPMRNFSACYSHSGENVPWLTAASAGETLIGVSQAVFERTAFIRQTDMGVEGSAELEKRIGALLSSGEEDASYQEARSRLTSWQHRRRYRGRGHLPELERQLEELRAQLAELEKAQQEQCALDEAVKTAQAQLAARQHLLGERREQERRDALEKGEALRRRAQELETAAAQAQARQKAEQEALCQNPLAAMEIDGLHSRVEAVAAQAEELLAGGGGHSFWWLSLLLLCVAAALFVLCPWYYAASAAGLAVLLLLCDRCLAHKRKKRCRAARELLKPWGADSPQALRQAYIDYEQRLKYHQERVDQAQSLCTQAAEASERWQQHLRQSLSTDGEDALLYQARQELSRAEQNSAHGRGRLELLGDALVLKSRVQSLEERREQEEREYAALSLALETLEEADRELRRGFSPQLAQRAAHYFSRLTQGRYEELLLDGQLRAQVRGTQELLPRESDFLSQGAGDQLYLALRLALCDLVLPEDEKCPLILDDALLAFDDKRMKLAMELLRELAKERQIILFTCQKRERKYLKKEKNKGKS